MGSLQQLDISRAFGPNGTHPTIIKPLANMLREGLARLFDASLVDGELPADWLESVVIPVTGAATRTCASSTELSV